MISPIKAVRFYAIINEQDGNVASYNTKLDSQTKFPSAYDQAIMTARAYGGAVYGDLGDGKSFPVKSFVK